MRVKETEREKERNIENMKETEREREREREREEETEAERERERERERESEREIETDRERVCSMDPGGVALPGLLFMINYPHRSSSPLLHPLVHVPVHTSTSLAASLDIPRILRVCWIALPLPRSLDSSNLIQIGW